MENHWKSKETFIWNGIECKEQLMQNGIHEHFQ